MNRGIEPLEELLDELVQAAKNAGSEAELSVEWGSSRSRVRSEMAEVRRIRQMILDNARWIQECDCHLPEQTCPTCCPDLYKPHKTEAELEQEEIENKIRNSWRE